MAKHGAVLLPLGLTKTTDKSRGHRAARGDISAGSGTNRKLGVNAKPGRLAHESLLAGQMSADYCPGMTTINLTDDELAAVTVAIRRAIEDDRFPHAPRLDPLRAALAKLDAA
jgi:hypothetical protein